MPLSSRILGVLEPALDGSTALLLHLRGRYLQSGMDPLGLRESMSIGSCIVLREAFWLVTQLLR